MARASAGSSRSAGPERRCRAGRQDGVALLAALMVVAMATLLAARLLVAQDAFVTQIQAERDILQAEQIARAGVDWARAMLMEDMMSNDVDHPGEPWAREVPAIDAEGGRISGRLRDAQARFNINALIGSQNAIDRPMLAAYVRLLGAAGVDPALGPRLAEWMRMSGERKAARDGRESMPGGRLWFALADLERVDGYTPAVLERLLPHLVALPLRTPINVNTADVIVLAAAGLTPAQAAGAVETRQRNWFRDVGDFVDRTRPQGFVAGIAVTQSMFFEAQVAARYHDARLTMIASLRRRPGRGVDVVIMRVGGVQ